MASSAAICCRDSCCSCTGDENLQARTEIIIPRLLEHCMRIFTGDFYSRYVNLHHDSPNLLEEKVLQSLCALCTEYASNYADAIVYKIDRLKQRTDGDSSCVWRLAANFGAYEHGIDGFFSPSGVSYWNFSWTVLIARLVLMGRLMQESIAEKIPSGLSGSSGGPEAEVCLQRRGEVEEERRSVEMEAALRTATRFRRLAEVAINSFVQKEVLEHMLIDCDWRFALNFHST